jgi:hypothetical protein
MAVPLAIKFHAFPRDRFAQPEALQARSRDHSPQTPNDSTRIPQLQLQTAQNARSEPFVAKPISFCL